MKTGRGGEKGFTLLEAIVAITVLGLLAASMVYLLTSQSRMSAKNSQTIRALGYAKQKLDSLKLAPYSNISSGSDTADAAYIRSWHVTATENNGVFDGRKKIDVTVYWELTGGHSVSLVTLVGDDRYKGE